MRSRMIRRGLVAAAILTVVVLIGVAALPFIASTQIVKDRLALELSRWSGYRVTLGRDPIIRVWPSMQAILGDVKLSEWSESGSPAVISSDSVEIDLSAIAALGGEIFPERIRLIRPVLRLRGSHGAYSMPAAVSGRFRQAIDAASALIASDPVNPDLARLPAEPVGTVEFVEGRVVGLTGEGSESELVTSLSGSIEWPAMNQPLLFRIGAIWRGETIALTGTIRTPLIVFAGGNGPMRVSLESAPLTAAFDGAADLSQPLFIAGDISLKTPSLGRAIGWAGIRFSPEIPSGAAALSGKLSGNRQKLKIDKASVTLGGNPGEGTLDIVMDGAVPAMSGTLAFSQLDLVALLSAYSMLPIAPAAANGSLNSELADLLNLDLRLSAASATAGPIGLSDVAAVIQVRDRLVTFDISDSKAFGGSVVTGIRIDRKTGSDMAEFRLLASEIDGAALSEAAGLDPIVPKARGKISVILKGPLVEPERFVEMADGSISAVFGSGTIGDVDLRAFLDRARAGGFFSLEEVGRGTLAFERAELKATMNGGVATIEKAGMMAAGQRLEFSGIADYADRSIVLSGTITPEGETQATDGVSVFVGGSWESPYISAIRPRRSAE